ncbi:MAG: hypothetical protein FIB01_06545, partial [Gemmatimonadetes bacterium]|nr:hypothetical protein [Gemmatimonadota bacterium]
MGRLSASTVLLAAACLAACGGGDSTSPSDNDPPNRTLDIAVTPGTVAVPAGSSGSVSVAITRGGGWSGNVTLQIEGVPAGVTASFAPASLTGTATGSTLNVTVAAAAAVGRSLMTVRASSSNVNDAAAQLWLDIPAPPDYSLRMARDTLSVIQGAPGQVDVNITRVSGFAGGVTLALEGAPAGVTGTFTPNPATADRSTLALQVAAAVASGRYPLTIRGTATGLTAHTTNLVLDVVSSAVPGYTLTVTPAAVTLVPGGNVPVNVTIRRSGGFTGGVSVGVQGHPTGVTWSVSPVLVTDSLATITLAASFAVTPGTYALTVWGSAAGLSNREAPLQLTVPVAPGFSLSLSNSAITSAPGGAPQTVSVQLTRTGGFADTVRLAMTGLPAGITATFTPAATVGNAQLTIAVTTADAGTYTGTVRANATGLAERTATISVTVIAGTDVVWRFCSPIPSPVFFAFQDGVSPYVTITPAGDGSYVTSVGSGKGAVVIVQPGLPDTASGNVPGPAGNVSASTLPAAGYTTYMYYGSVTDLQQLAQTQCPATGTTKTVYGTIAGVPAGSAWSVGLGGGTAVGVPPAAGSAFTLSGVLPGARDLAAGRAAYGVNQVLANAFVIRRDVDAPDGATLPVIDFGGGEAVAAATGTIMVSQIPAGTTAEVGLGFRTGNGTSVLTGQLDSVTSATRPIAGVPAARLRAGDLHMAIVSNEASSVEPGATLFAAQVGSWPVTQATAPPLPTVDVYATTPIVRMRARGVLGATGSAYGSMVRASFIQASAQRATVVYQTRGNIGTTQNFEIRTGGYNTLAGWNESLYGFQVGVATSFAVAQTNTGYVLVPADGTVAR